MMISGKRVAGVLTVCAGLAFSASPCFASLIVGTVAQQFAVLGEPTNDQTNFNNGAIINGDIGIGSPRQFTISNASLTGSIRFSAAANTSGLSPAPGAGGGSGPFTVSGGGTVSGNVVANDPIVSQAITYVNDLSQAVGTNGGTHINVTSGGSINASAGTLGTTASVDGNVLGAYRVFTVDSANFPNGTFTINGSSTDQVVLNIDFSANLHGQILLAGGITTDNVIINMFGGNSATFTGGPTLDVNTNALSTFGVFLDPFGSMSAVHTDLQGRFFGGDSVNQQIVSGANITAPSGEKILSTTPEPATLLLLGTGLVVVTQRMRRRKKQP